MNFYSTLLLGLAMSTDAFAAALGKGAGMNNPRWRDALRIGAAFGVVEGIAVVLGWLLGSAASQFLTQWADWIAFALLLALGIHMIWNSLQHKDEEESEAGGGNLFTILLASVATSIDSLAIGVGLAFMHTSIAVAAATIGALTFTMVTAGVMAGRALGALIGRRAELVGGAVLILVGAGILYQHLHK